MNIKTERLVITEFDMTMAKSVHLNSLDEDNRKFVPDEVFETIEEAEETVEFLMTRYQKRKSPLVYPVLLKDSTNIGYVQLVKIEQGWEIGYHIAKAYTCQGYASEAVKAFLEVIMKEMGLSEVYGICLAENIASRKVMQKCGFVLQYEGLGKYHGKQQEICHFLYRL